MANDYPVEEAHNHSYVDEFENDKRKSMSIIAEIENLRGIMYKKLQFISFLSVIT